MKKQLLLITGSLAIGFIIGTFYASRLQNLISPQEKVLELRQPGFSFINPLLECEVGGESMEFEELRPFKSVLQTSIDSLKKRGLAEYCSVYFRDLNNGPWFGINERERFNPASLLKVPLMMAYYKEAETNPGILNKKIAFANHHSGEPLVDTESFSGMKRGVSYTAGELIRRMIIHSDNVAYLLLLKDFSGDRLAAIYSDLGVPVPSEDNGKDIITVKQYASFFRILFNASYLNREMSIRSLELLSRTEFRGGIVAGVPPGIGVVHKFGVRDEKGGNALKQLHDCGIVYYPNHPYLLCVMSRGRSVESLDDSIREISAAVFNSVNAQLARQ